MPKQMFFNINAAKRKMFLDVALEEFTTKSFEQVSVNTIIKKANISRGSFYTYFEDLESLFNYLFEQVKLERIAYAKELLRKSDMDFFVFIKELFKYDYDSYSETGRYSLFRNYIHYIQTSKKTSLSNMIINGSVIEFTNNQSEVTNVFGLDKLKLSIDEFIDVIEMIVIIMINTFLKAENEEWSKEEAIALFNKRIGIIEQGVKG